MADLELETKIIRSTNFLQVMLEVETLVKSGWAINLSGTRSLGVQFVVVLNRAKQPEVAQKVEVKTEETKTVEEKQSPVKTSVKTTTRK
jgi:hypothetical protein